MLHTTYELKKSGPSTRPFVDFLIRAGGETELLLRPHLKFRGIYTLPDYVYRGPKAHLQGRQYRRDKEIEVVCDWYVDDETEQTLAGICQPRFPEAGSSFFLTLRPGPDPDYSDFLGVFDRVAMDLQAAWQKAVIAASKLGSNKEVEKEFIITVQKPEVLSQPIRRLRLS